jgi:hypothetical protein
MAPREMHQQSLYLEPEKAALLDKLAKRTRIPKAVLLREAVDLLLGIQGLAHVSPQLDAWRQSLMMCEVRLAKARHIEMPDEVDKACAEALAHIHLILETWGAPKEGRLSYDRNPPIGANSHKAKKARKAKQ